MAFWTVRDVPAAATRATASKAATGGKKHKAQRAIVCLACGTTASDPITINLRDGASGAGTILVSWELSAPASTTGQVDAKDLALEGSYNTAMTLEFVAGGPAASVESVTLVGEDVD